MTQPEFKSKVVTTLIALIFFHLFILLVFS